MRDEEDEEPDRKSGSSHFFNRRKAGSIASASGLKLASVASASDLQLAPVAYAPTIWLTIAAASVTFTCLSPLTSASRNLRIEAFSKLSYAALYML